LIEPLVSGTPAERAATERANGSTANVSLSKAGRIKDSKDRRSEGRDETAHFDGRLRRVIKEELKPATPSISKKDWQEGLAERRTKAGVVGETRELPNACGSVL